MRMDEYLAALTGQIRSKKVRGMVEEEIRAHLEDQAAAYEEQGMPREQAVQKAVEQMGDPVTVGIELDQIHRPKAGWRIILMILAISFIGLLAQYFFYYRFADARMLPPRTAAAASPLDIFWKQCGYTLAGLGVMILLYLIDYSMIGRWAKSLGASFLAGLWMVWVLQIFPVINGSYFYMKCVLYLFVPVFGGILHQYRNTGMTGVLKCLIWIGAAFWAGIRFIGGGLGVTLDMAVICWILLLAAVGKGWFAPSKKLSQVLPAVLLPMTAAFWGAMNLYPYQIARIQAIISYRMDPESSAYINNTARELTAELTFHGAGWKQLLEQEQLPIQRLPGVSYDYIMLQIASVGGIAAAALLILILAGFYLYLTKMVFRQKNQLGQMMGLGCVLVLFLETLRNLANNFGFYTLSTGGLPFFSYGRSHTIMVYALLGILLSIYRYQNVAQEPTIPRTPPEAGVLFRLGSHQLRKYRPNTWETR